MCCTRLAENAGCKEPPSGHHRTTLSGYIFTSTACIDNRKKFVKQQYLLQMSSQYGELWSTNSWDPLASLGHPNNSTGFAFWLPYCTDVVQVRSTKLCRMFGSLFGWYTKYIYIFEGSCTLTEFCQLQKSLCIQVLCSPILAALLHGTRAAAVSQTLWRGTRNGITELLQTAPPVFGWAAIRLCIGQHSSFIFIFICAGYLRSLLLLLLLLSCAASVWWNKVSYDRIKLRSLKRFVRTRVAMSHN